MDDIKLVILHKFSKSKIVKILMMPLHPETADGNPLFNQWFKATKTGHFLVSLKIESTPHLMSLLLKPSCQSCHLDRASCPNEVMTCNLEYLKFPSHGLIHPFNLLLSKDQYQVSGVNKNTAGLPQDKNRIPDMHGIKKEYNLLTAHKKRNGIYSSALILILLGFQAPYPHYSIPFINRAKSAKDFYLKAIHLIKPDEEIGYCGKHENYALIFYTARYTTFLGDEEKVRSFMKTLVRRFIITSSKRYPYFENQGWKKVLTTPYYDFNSKYGYVMLQTNNNLTQILQ